MDPCTLSRYVLDRPAGRGSAPNDLRHAAARLIRTVGIDVEVIGEVLGHADAATILRISLNVQSDTQATALAALDCVLGS